MTGAIRTVFLKEALENLRDRRVIFSALVFGVLLAPVIFALTTTLLSKRLVRDQDRPLQLPVVGVENAPNLLHFLKENGVDVLPVHYTESTAMEAVRTGRRDFVLIIPETYGEKLRAGGSAPVDFIVDTANSGTASGASRAQRLLNAYGRQLATLRLLVRGVSPEVLQPVDVRTLDIATPAGRSLLILGMMTYFCFMSMLMGGFYLAIDTTAGERERGSLEPLLSLPVSRESLILGKILATAAYMSVSLLLTLIAFSIVLLFVPLEALGMSANFGPRIVVSIFAVMVTFVPVGAGLMTVVASFTRSNREAQTWLSFVMMIPMAPILVAVLNNTRPSAALMAIPSLSQHLIATGLMRGDPIHPLHVAISFATTLLVGGLLIWVATRLYRRDAILG
jgi:sodium transport system permease protein